MVFPRAALRDFPWAKPKGNHKERPCHTDENPFHPDTFTEIYIISLRKIDGLGPVDNRPSTD